MAENFDKFDKWIVIYQNLMFFLPTVPCFCFSNETYNQFVNATFSQVFIKLLHCMVYMTVQMNQPKLMQTLLQYFIVLTVHISDLSEEKDNSKVVLHYQHQSILSTFKPHQRYI